MLKELLPFSFQINTTIIAGTCLWALTLYLGFSSLRNWIMEQLERWLNFADRSLYISSKEFEDSRPARESQNEFYASILSIIPFLVFGLLCNYGVEICLGRSWAVSMGLLTCLSCSVYQLGRQSQ